MNDRRLLGLAVLLFVPTAGFWIYALSAGVPFVYSDGDTATWIWLLRHGEPLYALRAGLPMRVCNYPPLFLHLVAALAPSDGAILVTGSLFACAGFALAAGMVAWSAAAATGSRARGLFAALLVAGTLPAGLYAAACLPDAVAFGLAATGLTLVARRTRGWPLLAGGLFAIAALTKHSLVVFPLGACGWALWRLPRQGAILVAAMGGPVALALWRLDLYAPLVAWTRGAWSVRTLALNLAFWVVAGGCGIAAALLLLRRWRELPAAARAVLEPWGCVLAAALLWLLALGRTGSGSNYVMELVAAVAVLATAALHFGLASARLVAAHVVLTLLPTAGALGYIAGREIPARQHELRATARALAGVPGEVLAEQSWSTTVLGRPPVVVPFLAAQLAQGGTWDPAPLLAALREGRIARVLLGFSPDDAAALRSGHGDRFTPAVLDAIRARYVLVDQVASTGEAGALRVYRPR